MGVQSEDGGPERVEMGVQSTDGGPEHGWGSKARTGAWLPAAGQPLALLSVVPGCAGAAPEPPTDTDPARPGGLRAAAGTGGRAIEVFLYTRLRSRYSASPGVPDVTWGQTRRR